MKVLSLVLGVFASTLSLLIGAVQLCMMIHAIMSWFVQPGGRTGPVMSFIHTVVELVTAPMRRFLARFDWARRSPLDFSFLFTFILLSVISSFLGYL